MMEDYVIRQAACPDSMRMLDDSSVGLVLTDPPYNLARFMKRRAHPPNMKAMLNQAVEEQSWDDMDNVEFERLMRGFMRETMRVLRDNGTLICFTTARMSDRICEWGEDAGLYYKTVGVWAKGNIMPLNMNLQPVSAYESWVYMTKGNVSHPFHNEGRLIRNIVKTQGTPSTERVLGSHPTQKPIGLMQWFIRLFTDPGELVADPFCGSGTTGVAALLEHRRVWMADRDPKWVDLAERRCAVTYGQPGLF